MSALQTTFAGPTDSNGTAPYADWPYDSGLASPGWRVWTLGNDQRPATNVLICRQFVNHVALLPGEAPIQNPFSFDFDKDPSRVNRSANLINADSTDLTSFRTHGGKLILYTGMSDPVFSAKDLIRYYGRLSEANRGMASTQQFARLFRVPGMNHCAGGPALDDFDDLTAIEDWVEKGAPIACLPPAKSSLGGVGRFVHILRFQNTKAAEVLRMRFRLSKFAESWIGEVIPRG